MGSTNADILKCIGDKTVHQRHKLLHESACNEKRGGGGGGGGGDS